ncbi:MAG: hypothetical protein ACI8X5_002057 [Planctomycetota bacterium]|jgi:hypothetical protein
MELDVFPDPAVAVSLNLMVEARIHNDGADQDVVRKMQDDLIHTGATPSYALMDPATGDLIDVHEGPETDPAKFSKWLKRAYSKWDAAQ